VNGVEKVLIWQEKMQCNFPFVKGNETVELRSLPENSLNTPATIFIKFKMRSLKKLTSSKIKKNKSSSTESLYIKLPYIICDIPIGIVFYALGKWCKKKKII
jgi:hypothetical protein